MACIPAAGAGGPPLSSGKRVLILASEKGISLGTPISPRAVVGGSKRPTQPLLVPAGDGMDEVDQIVAVAHHAVKIERQRQELMHHEDRKGCALVPCFDDGRGKPVEELVWQALSAAR